MPKKRIPRRRTVPAYSQQRDAPETNLQLAAAIFEIVDTQLREHNPPQTRQTFDRLVAAGHSPEGARQLLAHVVIREIFTVMARGEVYDEARFVAALERLPQLPEDTDT